MVENTLIFKGIKQVTQAEFAAAKAANGLVGYMWFVRTPKPTDGSIPAASTEDTYDIYFGSRHYGHYKEGEISTLISDVEKLKGQLDGVAENTVIGLLNEKVNNTAFEEFQTANTTALNKKAGYAELSEDGNVISFYKDNSEGKGDALFTIDSSKFVKDGMLSDVQVTTPATLKRDITYGVDEEGHPKVYHQGVEGEKDTKFLYFVWNVDAPKEGESQFKEDFVLLTDIAPVYTAADETINITENKVKVGIVRTAQTKTNADITIAGGPLASKEVAAAFPDGVIPAGTDMQALFMKLLCVEKWPTVSTSKTSSIEGQVVAPSITMTTGFVEVGTPISVTVKNGASSIKSSSVPYASGFEYGYSTADNNKKEQSGKEVYANITNKGLLSDTSSLTVTGKVSGTKTGTSASASATVTGNFKAVEGTNTVSASNTGATYTMTYDTLPVYYGCSNLKNTHDEEKNTKPSEEVIGSTVTSVAPEANASKTCTGVYPIFCNGEQATGTASVDKTNPLKAPKVDTKLGLMEKGKEHFYVKFAKHASAGYTLYLPKGRTISSAVGINGLTGNYELKNNASAYAKQSEGRQFTIQGNLVDYDVYIYKADEGANSVEFKLDAGK